VQAVNESFKAPKIPKDDEAVDPNMDQMEKVYVEFMKLLTKHKNLTKGLTGQLHVIESKLRDLAVNFFSAAGRHGSRPVHQLEEFKNRYFKTKTASETQKPFLFWNKICYFSVLFRLLFLWLYKK